MLFLKKKLPDISVDELTARKQPIIGLDVGDKAVGISISDTRIRVASPLATLARKNIEHDCKKLIEKMDNHNVGLVVFGWPLHMDGTVSHQCEKILGFIAALSEFTNVNFVKWDERFSTSVVDKIMIKADMSRKKRKQVIDKIAAVYILQGAIDFLNRKNSVLIALVFLLTS